MTRRRLAVRREQRKMKALGWEYVGEGGGKLWELYRGGRVGHRIVGAAVDITGLGIWVLVKEGAP
jgi:hypothetical protein